MNIFSFCQVQEILDEDEALSTDPSQDDGEFFLLLKSLRCSKFISNFLN